MVPGPLLVTMFATIFVRKYNGVGTFFVVVAVCYHYLLKRPIELGPALVQLA